MSSSFWTNTIWYVLLGISTLIELVFVIVKTKRRRFTFAFYLTITGSVLFFETAILIYFKSYTYYPKIFHNAPLPYNDVIAGNLFSQFSVAATALLITVFNLKWYWYLTFSAIYGLIEELFLALGIYSHNWYRTWMTVALLPLFFWISKKVYIEILQGVKPIFYFGFIFLGLFPLHIVAVAWPFLVFDIMSFRQTILPDPISSLFLLAQTFYYFLVSILMSLIYYFNPKWIWKALVILLLYVFYYFCYKYNLILIKKGWFLPANTIIIFSSYISIFIMDKLYGRPLKN